MEDALNRVADALFAIAKEERRSAKASERSVAIQEKLYEFQEVSLRVSKALEERLLAQQAYESANGAN